MKKHTIAKISFQLQWYVIVVVLFFSTIAFGGIYPNSVYITRLFIVLSLFLQAAIFFCEENSLKDFDLVFFIPLSLFAAFLLVVYFQCFFGVRILHGSIVGSINVHATHESLIQLIYYFLFFIACFKVTSKRELVERLGSLIAVLVFTIAVLGLAQRLAGTERILWKHYTVEEGSFFGPFINENHFGGFLGLTFPFILGLMHYRFHKFKNEVVGGQHGKALWMRSFALLNTGVGFLFFLIVIALGASFFSLARLSSIVLALCCAAYFVIYGMNRRNSRFYLTLILIFGSLFLLLWWLGYDMVSSRFTVADLYRAWNVRLGVLKQSLALFNEFPFFGTGLSTYRFISSKVVSYLINQVSWHHVENDFAELLIETGVVGFCLFMFGILIILFLSVKRVRENPSRWNRLMVNQALVSILCIGIMEYFDFHLKIPANAFLFILQLALLFRLSFPTKEDGSIRNKAVNSLPFYIKGGFLLLSLTLGSFLMFSSTKTYQAYQLSQARDNRLAYLKEAVALEPSNARLWYELGEELGKQTKTLTATDGRAFTWEEEAISALRKAVALNPADGSYWYHLGALEYSFGHESEGIVSLEKAVDWAPQTLKYSIYLLAADLRESERTKDPAEKERWLSKSRVLYMRLKQFETKPNSGDFGGWMGDHYFGKLKELMPDSAAQ